MVEIKVNGTQVHAVVSMGAEVTLLSDSFFRCIDEKETSGGTDGPWLKLHNAEDGSSMNARRVEAHMQIGSFEKIWSMLVAPIQ